MRFISSYDYSCFRCLAQRTSRNSMRIGISPDATLAYMDMLYDEDSHASVCKPLCPIGQARLPGAFRLAGLGSYFSPYYLDTNDLLLQAVPQTDVASAFIDEAWISFIVELNSFLRTVQSNNLYIDVIRLSKFLHEKAGGG
ncbi:hypothetical protein EON64_16450, partial [archaeon]